MTTSYGTASGSGHANTNDPTAGEKTWLTNALAGQVAFPATVNPSAGANVLDDYEEGSWTPVVTFGVGVTGITYDNQVGSYVKIGRLVYFNLQLNLSSNGSSTGTLTITGLPFACGASPIHGYACASALRNITFVNVPSVFVNPGEAFINFGEIVSVGGAFSVLTDADVADNALFVVSGSYYV